MGTLYQERLNKIPRFNLDYSKVNSIEGCLGTVGLLCYTGDV